MRARLNGFLAAFLGATACAGVGKSTLDDVACLDVDVGEACPDEAAASVALVGDTTCESPVREVTSTGAFVSEEDVIYTGYGGFGPPESGDTGTVRTRCCYEASYKDHPRESCTIGRPLLDGDTPRSAALVARADWATPGLPGTGSADWASDALAEHASVGAFTRLLGDLLALAAPPELLARTAQALQDEVRHAQDAFALASAAGAPVGPGPLTLPARRGRRTLSRLAVEAFREGCVGETLAVGLAAARLRCSRDAAERAVLARVVADESRHAELSWDLVRWAVAEGGPPVRRALAREVAALGRPADARDALVNEALARVMDDVIRPSAAELLAA